MKAILGFLIILGELNFLFAMKKRALIFPRIGQTRHQLIVGFGVPLQLKLEAETVGIVLKATYQLVSLRNCP